MTRVAANPALAGCAETLVIYTTDTILYPMTGILDLS